MFKKIFQAIYVFAWMVIGIPAFFYDVAGPYLFHIIAIAIVAYIIYVCQLFNLFAKTAFFNKSYAPATPYWFSLQDEITIRRSRHIEDLSIHNDTCYAETTMSAGYEDYSLQTDYGMDAPPAPATSYFAPTGDATADAALARVAVSLGMADTCAHAIVDPSEQQFAHDHMIADIGYASATPYFAPTGDAITDTANAQTGNVFRCNGSQFR